MIRRLQTLQLDPSDEVEVFTAGPSGATVKIVAHKADTIWIVQPAKEGTSLFDRGFLLPATEQKIRLLLGNGQSVSVLCDPTCGATVAVSITVEVPNA